MINAEGENVDLYIPRKCSWTNRLIEAKDHASVQVNIGHLDQSGVYNGQYTTLALSGFVRCMVSEQHPAHRRDNMSPATFPALARRPRARRRPAGVLAFFLGFFVGA